MTALDWRTKLTRLGHWRAVLLITGFSVFSSLGVTTIIALSLRFSRHDYPQTLLIAALVPAVVAPTATHWFVKLLYELETMRAELEFMATRDALTQAYNRGYFMDRLDVEVERAVRTRVPLSLMMIDVDEFKSTNDQHGHAIGDIVLQAVAQTSGAHLRPYDVLARYGGDEFVVLMPSAPLTDACAIAERVGAAITRLQVQTEEGAAVRVSVSLGVSCLMPSDPEATDLIERADAALYKAKRSGRNRWAS